MFRLLIPATYEAFASTSCASPFVSRCLVQLIRTDRAKDYKIRGMFLESPENFSGSKSQLSNWDPLVLKN